MIASNFFRAIGDFCTNVLFAPYNAFRFAEGWWLSNTFNTIIVAVGFIAAFYWLGQMVKHNKQEKAH